MLAALGAACGPQVAVESKGRLPEPREVALKEALPPGAAAYNEEGAPTVRNDTEVTRRLMRLVAEGAASLGVPEPRRDPRLDAAAEALARVLPEEGHTPFDVVEFIVQHYGIIEPAPHLIIAVVSEDAMDAFEGDFRARLPNVLSLGRYRRIGIGVVPWSSGQRLVVAFQESFVRTAPFPKSLAVGGSAPFRGEVMEPFSRPRVIVTRPDGNVEKVGGGLRRTFDVVFRCSAKGKYQVELTADDPFGATVLANFPVYCGIPVPERVMVASADDEEVTNAGKAEERLCDLLNTDRRRAGLSPLAWDERLARVAREHSKDMLAHGFVGHISPRSGDPGARAARAGLRPQVLLENVARAYSVGEAHRGLMQSPGHRQNCLSRDVTHVGIGVALGRDVGGRREFYVTQLFAAEVTPALPVGGERSPRGPVK